MGYAIGVMRMNYRDFFRMTGEEFTEAARAYRENEERLSRERWEIMRMQSSILIQPYVKKKLTARELLEFPWDTKADTHEDREPEDLTIEERKRLAAEAVKKWG